MKNLSIKLNVMMAIVIGIMVVIIQKQNDVINSLEKELETNNTTIAQYELDKEEYANAMASKDETIENLNKVNDELYDDFIEEAGQNNAVEKENAELYDTIEELEAENTDLENKIANLESKIAELEASESEQQKEYKSTTTTTKSDEWTETKESNYRQGSNVTYQVNITNNINR